MDEKFTEKIKEWLETPADERDYVEGAVMLLRLSGNRIEYRNLSFAPERRAAYIEQRIRKYYNFRVADLTHKQVAAMQRKADSIMEDLSSFKEDNPAKDFAKGKRADHESLPDEIQKCYTDNMEILHRMRDIQTKLRLMSTEEASCPDSERYPFLKELIALDKRRHKNWQTYDHYVPSSGNGVAQPQQDGKSRQRRAVAFLNLNKRRLATNPGDNELREKMEKAFREIGNPSEKLTREMENLGIKSV